MIRRVEVTLRYLRRAFSRSEWAIRLLRISKLKYPTSDPGLVMIQIDGLSLTQINRSERKGRVKFLRYLLDKENYTVQPFYSGLPSNTPAVQGELFYGIKGCVPSFSFIDRTLGEEVKMMDAAYVEKFETSLQNQQEGLLARGSSYSNIFTGGAKEAHFCWAKLGWGGVLHAVNPLVFPFLIILYIDIFIRTFVLLFIEFVIALFECIRGTLTGRLFLKELEFVWLRVFVCVFLREIIVAGACMDIMRGLPIIHLNFLGYDEQAHCRGPSSQFAHWSLQGIDRAIKRIYSVMQQAPYREYDLWIYGDHGQEKTIPYIVEHGRTIQEAVEELFVQRKEDQSKIESRQQPSSKINFSQRETIVTAMGPLGQIYVKRKLEDFELEWYARRLVSDLKIPLVMTREETQTIQAYNSQGKFNLPAQMGEVFGHDHPFLEEMKDDILRLCFHKDAGEFIIAGWCKGELPRSFSLEFGAHAGMGTEETQSFALLPADAPVRVHKKKYLRPLDLREGVQRFLNKERFTFARAPSLDESIETLRLISYNVHGCMGMDGSISSDRIARVLARHSPDVVALQELDVGRLRSHRVDQVAQIAKNLRMNYHFHPTIHQDNEKYGNAILSRFPLDLIKMAGLPRLFDQRRHEPRGALWVSMEYKGIRIQIINTHLSIWPQERSIQASTLLNKEWLAHHLCSGPVILCGDFNALPQSQVYRRISQRLKDSQSILAGHCPGRTWFGRYPLSQIDYIFVSREFEVLSVNIPRTNLDKLASDHLPLIVDLTFGDKELSGILK